MDLHRSLPALIAALLTVACESPSQPLTGGPVDVSLTDRAFVEELVRDVSHASGWSVRTSSPGTPPHIGFGGWLLGREDQFLASASLVETRSGEYEPFCNGDSAFPSEGFWSTRDRCSRLRIEDSTYFMDLYFTERPRRLPGDRHPFSYVAEQPAAGGITYDVNPFIVWSFVQPGDGSVHVRADFDMTVSHQENAGSEIDLSHSGFVSAVKRSDGSQGDFRLSVEFSGLTECDVPLSVSVIGSGADVQGSVSCGDREIAAIGHGEEEFVFTWHQP